MQRRLSGLKLIFFLSKKARKPRQKSGAYGKIIYQSWKSGVDEWRSPVSGRSTTIVLPSFSGLCNKNRGNLPNECPFVGQKPCFIGPSVPRSTTAGQIWEPATYRHRKDMTKQADRTVRYNRLSALRPRQFGSFISSVRLRAWRSFRLNNRIELARRLCVVEHLSGDSVLDACGTRALRHFRYVVRSFLQYKC